jgi:hypothetical protein
MTATMPAQSAAVKYRRAYPLDDRRRFTEFGRASPMISSSPNCQPAPPHRRADVARVLGTLDLGRGRPGQHCGSQNTFPKAFFLADQKKSVAGADLNTELKNWLTNNPGNDS